MGQGRRGTIPPRLAGFRFGRHGYRRLPLLGMIDHKALAVAPEDWPKGETGDHHLADHR